jgi:hypothetical protein
MHTMRTAVFKRGFLGAVLALCALPLSGVAQAPPNGSADAKLARDFQDRTKQYLDLRKKVAGKSTSPTDSPQAITSRQRELANKVRVARAGRQQGEIFTPEIAQYFRQQIANTLRGPHGDKIRASMRHAEPVKLELQVNQSYPESVPLQSTPPSLLLNLPQLPDGLEYRLVGRELVLRDIEANIVVDYVPNAFPS